MSRGWLARALRTFGLVGLFALSSLGSLAEAQTRELVVWHAYQRQEEAALREVARAFEREHPGTRIRLLAQPFGAYASKLESSIPTGRGPDLFIDAHERLPSYLALRLVTPFVAIGPETLARIDTVHLDLLRADDALHGLPIALKCAALYVNRDLMPEGPASLEALEAMVGRLPTGAHALAMQIDTPYWAASLLHAYGVSLIDEEGHWAFEGPAAERAVAHLGRLVEAGVVPDEADGNLVRRLFADGRAAAAVSGPWLAPDLPENLRWEVLPLPPVDGADGRAMRPFLTIEAAFIAEGARDRELAEDFARFLTFGEGAFTRAETGRQVVTDREVLDDSRLSADTFLTRFREAAEGAVPMSVHPHMRMVFDPADRALKKILRGATEPTAALLEGRHRFEDVTRPLPEARDPTLALIFGGMIVFAFLLLLIRRLGQAEVRAQLRASRPAYVWVAHAAIAVGALVILPLLIGAVTSLFAGRGTEMHYVGLANYWDILTARGGPLLGTGSFYRVLLVTVLWTVLNIAAHVGIGVALALLLSRPGLHFKRGYRVLLILPWAVPSYVTALAWRGMFHRQFGAVNAILEALGAEPVSFFARFATAFSANVATNVWLGFPFMMVVTLGALTAIPKEVYEAAAVDGASAWQRFRLITVPLLGPFLAPAVAMGAVWTFNMFNVVFLVSAGEPDGSTEILVSEAYRWAFTRNNQYGYAAAYAVLIFLILWLGTRSLAKRVTGGGTA